MKCWGFGRSLLPETKEDNTRQIDLLINAGADDVVFEYAAVAIDEKRPFQILLEIAQPGDTILALEVRRLCSSSQEFMHIITELRAHRLRLVIPDTLTIDCRTEPYDPATSTCLELATALTKLDTSTKYCKTRFGSKGIRLQRKSIGRPRTTKADIPQIFFKYYPLYEEHHISLSEYARLCLLSRPTIYKYLALVRGNQ